MRNFISKLFIIVFCVIFTLLTASCSFDSEKTYSFDNFSVTLPNDFSEVTDYGYDYYLQNSDCIIAVTKETFNSLSDTGLTSESSTMDYANAIILANNINAEPSLGNNSNAFFEYDASGGDGIDYHYYTAIIKGSDAFWICRFACLQENAAEMNPLFREWTDKITTK